jgi:hypothetical protein
VTAPVRARLLAIPLLWLLMGAASAASEDASALKAKHAELREALEENAFRSPVHLASRESGNSISGDVHAVIRKPFAQMLPALEKPAAWCEILFLHLNTKYCRASEGAPAALDVAIGKKYDQPLDEAYRMRLVFSVAARSEDYMRVAMTAVEGPMSTRDYRIAFEAVPLDEARSFIHLSYAYGYGLPSKIAAQAYLGTIGSRKVGFTVAGRQPDGTPRYIGGMRGVVERNTMRYYLAIESYLGALDAPPQARLEKSLRSWYAATERFPRQLRELEQAEYLDMKRREHARQS